MKSLKTLIAYLIHYTIKAIIEFAKTSRFEKHYSKLQLNIQKKVIKALRLIKDDFYHPSLHTKKIKGVRESLWEARVDKNYRLIFTLKEHICCLQKVGPHDIIKRTKR